MRAGRSNPGRAMVACPVFFDLDEFTSFPARIRSAACAGMTGFRACGLRTDREERGSARGWPRRQLRSHDPLLWAEPARIIFANDPHPHPASLQRRAAEGQARNPTSVSNHPRPGRAHAGILADIFGNSLKLYAA